MGHRVSYNLEWNDEWILENYPKYDSIRELHRAYSTEVSPVNNSSFNGHIYRKLKLQSKLPWTEEEQQWLIENFSSLGSTKCVDAFYKQFGKKKTVAAISGQARKLNLLADMDILLKDWNYPRRVEIGTIREDNNGYLTIKTGGGSSGWIRLHKMIYEKHYGKVPDGYLVVFLDGNKRNFEKENLVAIPRGCSALMTKNDFWSERAEITKTGITWCELYNELKKQGIKIKMGGKLDVQL